MRTADEVVGAVGGACASPSSSERLAAAPVVIDHPVRVIEKHLQWVHT
jgi:hypothetical protein